MTFDTNVNFQTFVARHLTPPIAFSDICRQTFNARLNFQTFVAQTFNARLNFQTFVARTFNARFEFLGPFLFRISLAIHLTPVSNVRHLSPDI